MIRRNFCYRFTLKDVNYDLIAVTYDAKASMRLKMRLIVKIRSETKASNKLRLNCDKVLTLQVQLKQYFNIQNRKYHKTPEN